MKEFGKVVQKMINESKTTHREILKNVGTKVFTNTKEETPVDLGILRNNWRLNVTPIQAVVSNNTEYAPHVEYGHRTRGGKGYVEGVYMLKNNMDKAEDWIEKDVFRLYKKTFEE